MEIIQGCLLRIGQGPDALLSSGTPDIQPLKRKPDAITHENHNPFDTDVAEESAEQLELKHRSKLGAVQGHCSGGIVS
jgi:hypothetical protein